MLSSLNIVEQLGDVIADEFVQRPPTIGLIGLSGVGKSSTINAMFGTKLTVSATTRGTKRFWPHRFSIEGKKLLNRSIPAGLTVYDAVGLGEDLALDKNYLERYAEHLPKCDLAIWVVAARNRAVALDQLYMQRLGEILPPTIIAVNQVDLIEPLNWRDTLNLPSGEQEKHLATIMQDRKEKFSALIGQDAPLVAYSAKRFYRLETLWSAVVAHAPRGRKWMFELIKGFSVDNWLDQATGLSEAQKQEIRRQSGKDEPGQMSLISAINHALMRRLRT